MHIHIIAICGTGMASLAGMLKEAGFTVTGSDHNAYPPMSTIIENLGIKLIHEFAPANLDPPPDLIIVGNAVSKNNPEVKAMLERGLPYCSFPAALAKFFLHDKYPVVVSGTHGKTTTSSLLSWILESSGYEPGFLIGGIPVNFSRNYKIGKKKHFIIEGDEYDTAFFDKNPKFLHYKPKLAILTNIEFDHADIYHSIDEIKQAFRKFIALIPPDGHLIACIDNAHVRELCREAQCTVHTCGFHHESTWKLDEVHIESHSSSCKIISPDHLPEPVLVRSKLIGTYNMVNALCAFVGAFIIGVHPEIIAQSILSFRGVKRRQEVFTEINGITLIDDFAHHPTSVRETLAGLKARYKDRRLWALFEPRTATSKRNVFQEEYRSAFTHADKIIIAGVYQEDMIEPSMRLSPEQLAREINKNGQDALYIKEVNAIVDYCAQNLRKDDVVVIMSPGGFDNIYKKLPLALAHSTHTKRN
ncbi:MAG: UDP-N-acetylmuramate:L-alanyl-gamma-D-glutamyl-meso-diaminopimelate ligase [bacterium]